MQCGYVLFIAGAAGVGLIDGKAKHFTLKTDLIQQQALKKRSIVDDGATGSDRPHFRR